jgi:hypothetical protein
MRLTTTTDERMTPTRKNKELPPLEIRYLRALRFCEEMFALKDVSASWVIGTAAQECHVDRARLGEMYIDRMLACARAREELATLSAVDAEIDGVGQSDPGARPDRRRRSAKEHADA